ncbi:unnamed protein product [Prorocentrum cordatum]|uniref:Uncharacterized protein n=1 Tax=Prorocentrum cordatum TaxID=2364126 RepID=A0ABN9T6F4_9DINO|nr:unnamed protein product [Polarella glacialis]
MRCWQRTSASAWTRLWACWLASALAGISSLSSSTVGYYDDDCTVRSLEGPAGTVFSVPLQIFGLFGAAVRPPGARSLLRHLFPLDEQIDSALARVYDRIDALALRSPLMTATHSTSDLRHDGAPRACPRTGHNGALAVNVGIVAMAAIAVSSVTGDRDVRLASVARELGFTGAAGEEDEMLRQVTGGAPPPAREEENERMQTKRLARRARSAHGRPLAAAARRAAAAPMAAPRDGSGARAALEARVKSEAFLADIEPGDLRGEADEDGEPIPGPAARGIVRRLRDLPPPGEPAPSSISSEDFVIVGAEAEAAPSEPGPATARGAPSDAYAAAPQGSPEVEPGLLQHQLRDPDVVVSGGVDYLVRTWDPSTFEPLQVFEGHLGPVSAVEPCRGGRLASCSEDGTLRVWRLGAAGEPGALERTVWVSCLAVRSLCTLPGHRAACGAADFSLLVVSLASGEVLHRVDGRLGGGPEAELLQREGYGQVWTSSTCASASSRRPPTTAPCDSGTPTPCAASAPGAGAAHPARAAGEATRGSPRRSRRCGS